jgi:hypothetical protein
VYWLLSSLYDIYDFAKEARELRGRDFEFKYFVRALGDVIENSPLDSLDRLPIAGFLLFLSSIGIIGCIWSPRFTENKLFYATLMGRSLSEGERKDMSKSVTENDRNTESFLIKTKQLTKSGVVTLFAFVKDIYKIIVPMIDSILDKCTNIICKQQASIDPKLVKKILIGMLLILVYLVVF